MFDYADNKIKNVALQLDIIDNTECTEENRIPDSILVTSDGTCVLGAGVGEHTFYVIYFPSWEMMVYFLPELSIDSYEEVPISVEEINVFYLPPGPSW